MVVVKNDLFDYGLYIYQDTEGFKFSADSILLAELVSLKKHDNILDLCAGNMAVGQILSKYSDSKIVGFEIQKDIYDLAIKSIQENNLSDRLTVINDDINNVGNYYNNETFDAIVCNPPYFKVNSHIKNSGEKLSIARHEVKFTLEDAFKISKTYLKNKGDLYIVHRANRLDEIINYGFRYNIHIKDIELIKTKENDMPYIAVVRAVKNGAPGVKINSDICIDSIKTYQNIFRR